MTEVPDVAGATALAAGQNHACALMADGTVKCWGYVTPKQAPKVIEGLSGVTAIASGSDISDTCAITKDKKLFCWSEQQKVKDMALSNVTMVRGRSHLCASVEDGSLYCWGGNSYGELGIADDVRSKYEPTKVVDLADVIHFDVGAQHTCAVVKGGAVKCWGYNLRGQLGDGTLIDRKKPVAVSNVGDAKLPAAKDGADQAQESDVAMDWSGLPKECTKPAKLEAKSPKLSGDFDVVSAYASSKLGGKNVDVNLATFKMAPDKAYQPPRGKQFKLAMSFAKVDVDKKDAKVVDLGSYVFGLKEERKVSSSAAYKSGSTQLMNITLDGASAGTVTITHLDDTWVCGEIDLTTKDSKFKGPYAARMTK